MLLFILGVPGFSSRSSFAPGCFGYAMMIMNDLTWDSGMMDMATLSRVGLGGSAIFAS